MSFEGPFVAITWGFVALGSYLTYCILKYLKEKPPNAQTLLDGIHRQMFWIWMVENWMILLQITILAWGFKSEITAWIFGYGTIFVILASAIHLTICVVTRIGLVFFQEAIEAIPEDVILIGTIVFDGVAAATLWLIMYFSADYPPNVVTSLLPEAPTQSSQPVTSLILPLITFSCLSEVTFRIYVYFTITNLSNVLINSSTIAILILTYILGLVSAILINIFQINLSSAVFPLTFTVLLRSFLVPANILVRQDGVIQIFIDNLNDLEEDVKDFMTSMSNAVMASWHFLKSLKDLFDSNQVVPQEIELGSTSSSE